VCCCLPTPEIAAVQELFDDLSEDRAPETVLAFVALVPDSLEFVEVIVDYGAGPQNSLTVSTGT
jgi:hypothetical protein